MRTHLSAPTHVGVLAPGDLIERGDDHWIPLDHAKQIINGFSRYEDGLFHLTCMECEKPYAVDNGQQPDQYITVVKGAGDTLHPKCPACWPKHDLHRYRFFLAPLCGFLAGQMQSPADCDHELTRTRAWLTQVVPSRAEEIELAIRTAGGHCDCEILLNVGHHLEALLEYDQ